MHETDKKEKALLIVIKEKRESWSQEALALEFKALASSSGISIIETHVFNLATPNPRFYIGKGKVEEISELAKELKVNTVIFNSNLNSNQQRNLEDKINIKTLDRTQLILDIFARHAHTQEGILQVELAQLKYLLPRLRGKGIMLSRLGGGIGTRGPGEKKIEVDRRRIDERITHLKKELKLIIQRREVMRKKREKSEVNSCSLVGYTSAGKTTLFNVLTSDSQKEAHSLFTTLDTVSRSFSIHQNFKVVISDTVGFIYRLPPYLIEAFKATLEELHYSDVLIHVVDASGKDIFEFKRVVDEILKELKLGGKKIIVVFNKIDCTPDEQLSLLKNRYPQSIFISALKETGIEELKQKIYQCLSEGSIEALVYLPFSKMKIASYFHEHCEILKKSYENNETIYRLRLEKENLAYLEKIGLKIKKI